MSRRRRSSKLIPLVTVAITAGALTIVAPPAQSATVPDDTPTLLTPKGEHEDGSDEATFEKLRDAYYWSRLLSGDDQLPMGQAAALRSSANAKAGKIANDTVKGAAR